jgi:hypothetical protein
MIVYKTSLGISLVLLLVIGVMMLPLGWHHVPLIVTLGLLVDCIKDDGS